jgi:hypothetical protein
MYFDTLTFRARLMFSSLRVMLTFTFSSFSDAHRLATFAPQLTTHSYLALHCPPTTSPKLREKNATCVNLSVLILTVNHLVSRYSTTG